MNKEIEKIVEEFMKAFVVEDGDYLCDPQ